MPRRAHGGSRKSDADEAARQGLHAPSARPHRCRAARVPAQRRPDRQQHGRRESRRGRSPDSPARRRTTTRHRELCGGQRRRCRRNPSRATAAADHGNRRPVGDAVAEDGVRERLSGRRRHLSCARHRRDDRDHRPRGGSVAVPRARDAPLRLALRRLAAHRGRNGGRASSRMLRASQRRVLRRSRARRTSSISQDSASRSPMSPPMERSGSASSPTPADASILLPARNSCSTSCTIRPSTSRRTACSTSPSSSCRKPVRIASASAGRRLRRARPPTRSRSAITTVTSARARSRTRGSMRWPRRNGPPKSFSSA